MIERLRLTTLRVETFELKGVPSCHLVDYYNKEILYISDNLNILPVVCFSLTTETGFAHVSKQ